MKSRILVVSNNVPRPDISSGERRFVSILEMLLTHWDVDFCVAPGHVVENPVSDPSPYADRLALMGIRVLPLKRDTFRQAIATNRYAGGYFNLYWIAEEVLDPFRKHQPGAFVIVDSVDVHYARLQSQADLGELDPSLVAETREKELQVYRKADAVIAVSKEDSLLLQAEGGIGNIFLVPNIVREHPRDPGKRDPVVIFIGCYAWYPNPAAVTWFADEIWPAVYRAVPGARFLVIGSQPTEEVLALDRIPGIEVTGYVPETGPWLGLAAVSVAPMRVGGGMKGKVNEAMAHAVPVVATTIGAQGFEAGHGKQIMIADDPGEFASCVITLLQDEEMQREIGLAGQRLNSEICSVEAVAAKIDDLANFCSARFAPRKYHRARQWMIMSGMKLEDLAMDTVYGFRLLRREGPVRFMQRGWMYLHGLRLPEEPPLPEEEVHAYTLPAPSGTIEFPPMPHNPLVSVIVPAYNQFEYTHACLRSICDHPGEFPAEVILADDNSGDDTRNAGQFVRNIRIIRNETNLGFLLNCNHAASLARGKYLVFLNNDTLVQPDWLDWLIKTMEEHADVGLAGGKLVFSTGHLQEAGGIVYRDGSAANYGRGDLPDLSPYNYFKDADYCSGACICIRKELWDRAGGFDPVYSPGYYDDTDLAARVREMGYRTVYQPKTVIVHFEGISHGIDITSGIKSRQPVNQKSFFNRWQKVLERDHYARDENLFRARDRSRYKRIVLLVGQAVPGPGDRDAATREMIGHFCRMGDSVKFLPADFNRPEPGTTSLEQAGVEVLYGDYYRKNWQAWVGEHAAEFGLVCFAGASLKRKWWPLLKKTLPGNTGFEVYEHH